MTVQTRNEVFLGIVVHPKTKRPIYVTRERGHSLTVQTWEEATENPEGAGLFTRMGEGYLDSGNSEYAITATLSGFPRSHTPGGVSVRGGGYGTCLYTGLVLLAHAESESLIHTGNISASGSGISSRSADRSSSADAWWVAAGERGLTTQIEGPGGEEMVEEEEEGADVEDHVSSRAWTKIRELIQESVSEYEGWWPTDIHVTADLKRETEQEADIEVDVYTFDSAWAHGLVALIDVVPSADEGEDNAIETWASAEEDIDAVIASKEVLLGLNLAHEPRAIAEKLVRIAAALGATEQEVADMRLRNRMSITLPEDAPASASEGAPVEALRIPQRRRLTAEAREALDRLADHRAQTLPWSEIEDLP